jgi:hypothetical protein
MQAWSLGSSSLCVFLVSLYSTLVYILPVVLVYLYMSSELPVVFFYLMLVYLLPWFTFGLLDFKLLSSLWSPSSFVCLQAQNICSSSLPVVLVYLYLSSLGFWAVLGSGILLVLASL